MLLDLIFKYFWVQYCKYLSISKSSGLPAINKFIIKIVKGNQNDNILKHKKERVFSMYHDQFYLSMAPTL